MEHLAQSRDTVSATRRICCPASGYDSSSSSSWSSRGRSGEGARLEM